MGLVKSPLRYSIIEFKPSLKKCVPHFFLIPLKESIDGSKEVMISYSPRKDYQLFIYLYVGFIHCMYDVVKYFTGHPVRRYN